jgi:DNA-binding response OmpR family regulator
MTEARLLVVDDEAAERITLGEVLRLEGYQVSLAASGEEALESVEEQPPFDVVILDLKLPGIDGLQVLESIHEDYPNTIIILITGYATLETALQAMRKGAYDYLLKPCPVEEILAAVHNGLDDLQSERHRRSLVEQLQDTVQELVETQGGAVPSEPQTEDEILEVDDVRIDRARHEVTRAGNVVELTPTEFRLLECLMERADEVCTPQELVRCAQGYEADAWGARSIVRVHVRRLRSKLEPVPERPRYIVNIRGVGYMFASQEE